MISFYAKKARGLMCRFAIQNRITQADDLKGLTSKAITSAKTNPIRTTGFSCGMNSNPR